MRNLIFVMIISVFMIGCQHSMPQNINTVGGGILGAIGGGIAGNQIGGGTGRIAATIGGTILGGALGSYLGSYMDNQDRKAMNTTLEHQPTGQPVAWQNPNTGMQHQMVPTNTYQTQSGQYCREFISETIINNEPAQMYGTACRQQDGSWQVVNGNSNIQPRTRELQPRREGLTLQQPIYNSQSNTF